MDGATRFVHVCNSNTATCNNVCVSSPQYYRFGEGECPFGTSCFYRHADRQGRLQDRVVRTVVGADGAAVVRPMKLSDYLATPHARAVLGAP